MFTNSPASGTPPTGAETPWDDLTPDAEPNCPDGSYYAADAFLERLEEREFKWEEVGKNKWRAQCPAHDGKDLNLHIAYGTEKTGALLLTCFSHGCSAQEIAEALDMSVQDLFNRDGDGEAAEEPVADPYQPPKEKREKPMPEGNSKLVDTFEFTDPTGRYLYHVERWEPGRRRNRDAGVWEPSGDRKSLHFLRKLHGKTLKSGIFDRTKYEDAPQHTLFNAVAVARAVADGEPVYVTEGMSAAKRLMADYKVTATSLDGGARSEWTPYITGQLSGATTVYLLMDADESGREWVRNALAALTGRVEELVVLHPATDKAGDDIVDHLDAGFTLDDMVEFPLSAFDATPEKETGRRLELTWVCDIEPEPVVWALKLDTYGVIPAAMVSLVAGREGTGKSTFKAWLVAHVTRGTLPGAWQGRPRRVLYIATEDSWQHTIVPRLIAAGADMTMVARVEAVTETGEYGTMTLPADTSLLKKAIREHDVALVCLDPLLSTLDSGMNTNTEHQVRQALDPIARLAQDTNIVFACIVHFNKSGGTDAASLIQNSGGFKNVARCILGFAKNKIEEENADGEATGEMRIERVMAVVKLSVGNEDQPLRTYSLEPVEIPTRKGPAETTKFTFSGFSDLTMEEVIAAAKKSPGTESNKDKAIKWMQSYLKKNDGHAPAQDVIEAGQAAGFAKRTLERWRGVAGIETRRSGFGTAYEWALVETSAPHARQAPVPRESGEHGGQAEATSSTNTEDDLHSNGATNGSHARHPRHSPDTGGCGEDGGEELASSEDRAVPTLRDLLDIPVTADGEKFPNPEHFAYLSSRSVCLAHTAEKTRIVSDLIPSGSGCPQCVRDLIAAEGAPEPATVPPAPDERKTYTRRDKKHEPEVETPASATTPQYGVEPGAPTDQTRKAPKCLTDEEKDAVRAAYENDSVMRELAEQYGVSKSVIHRIIPADARRPRGAQKKEAR